MPRMKKIIETGQSARKDDFLKGNLRSVLSLWDRNAPILLLVRRYFVAHMSYADRSERIRLITAVYIMSDNWMSRA